MVKAILFDCFGVLTTDTWRAFIDTLPDGNDKETAREAHRAYSAGLIDKEQCARIIRDATGRSFVEVEDTFDEKVAKNVALLDYIREQKKEHKIGLISNVATNWIRDSFLTLKEQALFDEMIFSFEVGMTKPDSRIFVLACERLRVAPEEAVLVDDIARYCDAARAVGMQAIVYEELEQMKNEFNKVLYPS